MIVCEIGLNHLGDEDYANQYVDTVLKSRADAVTFQILKDSFYEDERYKDFKLEKDFYVQASQKIKSANKQFGAALDDKEAVDFLESMGVSFYKILSKDIMNIDLLEKIATDTDKKIFISTGMSDLDEIDSFYKRIEPIKERGTLIHTQLTHDVKEVNLKAMDSLRSRYHLPVAFGMHCQNQNTLYLSLAFEPSDIFLYVRGDRTDHHPDEEHAVSLEDLSGVIDQLLELSQAIGSETKVKMDNWTERQEV